MTPLALQPICTLPSWTHAGARSFCPHRSANQWLDHVAASDQSSAWVSPPRGEAETGPGRIGAETTIQHPQPNHTGQGWWEKRGKKSLHRCGVYAHCSYHSLLLLPPIVRIAFVNFRPYFCFIFNWKLLQFKMALKIPKTFWNGRWTVIFCCFASLSFLLFWTIFLAVFASQRSDVGQHLM